MKRLREWIAGFIPSSKRGKWTDKIPQELIVIKDRREYKEISRYWERPSKERRKNEKENKK